MILRTIIVCPDEQLSAQLQEALSPIAAIRVSRILNDYPSSGDLLQAVRNIAAQVIFLSFQNLEHAKNLANRVQAEAPGVQVVGIHHEYDPSLLLEIMRCGVREFLAYPFERPALMDSLTHVKDMLLRQPAPVASTSHVFSFLPAKAGVGTSTLALNLSVVWARRPGEKVLLTDFDLNSGMIRFFLNLNSQYSVTNAIERAHDMDESLWPPMVAHRGNLDVLHAGPIDPSLRIDPAQISDLLSFLRRSYSILCFDLSGNLERYSLEVMRESSQILVVCTTEFASLHLAREKIHYLRKQDLGSRIRMVLNRVSKRSVLDAAQVEELLGVPVAVTLQNDYNAVTRAIAAGHCVDASSDLGKQFVQFADTLAAAPKPPASIGPKKKLLELFTVATNNVTALKRRYR